MALVWRVVEMPDRSVEVLKPPPAARRPGETDAAFCSRIYEDTVTRPGSKYAGRPYVDIDPSLVPSSRTKRAGWRLVGGVVVEDEMAYKASLWARKKDAPEASDDVLEWIVEQVNIVRAGLPTPLAPIDLADARNAVIQRKLRRGE